MATDTGILQGEVSENPEEQDLNVESLLAGFLAALLDEQRQALSLEPAPRGQA